MNKFWFLSPIFLTGLFVVLLVLFAFVSWTFTIRDFKEKTEAFGRVAFTNVAPTAEPKISVYVLPIPAEWVLPLIPEDAFNINILCVADLERMYLAAEGLGLVYSEGLAYIQDVPRSLFLDIARECGNYVISYTNLQTK